MFITFLVGLSVLANEQTVNQEAFSWAFQNCQSIAIAMPQNAQLEKRLNAVAREASNIPVKFFYQPVGSKPSVHGHGLSYDGLSERALKYQVRFVAEHLARHLAAPEYMRDCP